MERAGACDLLTVHVAFAAIPCRSAGRPASARRSPSHSLSSPARFKRFAGLLPRGRGDVRSNSCWVAA
jgi:hypothetical protein